MTFGTSSFVDLLSWLTATLLAIKLVATVVLLTRDRSTWLDARSTAALWWSSKIVPVLAVPCLILIATIEHDRTSLDLYAALMLFVMVMVPLVVARRLRASGTVVRLRR